MAKDGLWLVTGGCGFIGKSVIKKLVQLGVQNIRVIDNESTASLADLQAWVDVNWNVVECENGQALPTTGFHFARGDLAEPTTCNFATKNADLIFHLAALPSVLDSIENPIRDFHNGALTGIQVMEAARLNCPQTPIVMASSAAAVGVSGVPFSEQSLCQPISPYGAGKLTCEAYGHAYAHSYGMNIANVRFSNVYGPGCGAKESLVAKVLQNLFGNQPVSIHGDGLQTRDFIFLDDLTDGLVCIAERSQGGQVYQLGTGTETTVKDVVEKLIENWTRLTALTAEAQHTPERVGDVRRNYTDISKMAELLDWRPSTSIEDGLKRTVEWWLAEHPC